jgi:glycosyltransferase involved in cell wall biosynthesis
MDLSLWQGLQPEPRPHGGGLRLGYIGSLLRHKGVDLMLRAFQRLETTGAELMIHGFELPNTPYSQMLHKLGGADRRVHFVGQYSVSDLPGILNQLDILLIPALWHETFSFVTREAVLAGLPVIASRMGGIPEIIEDGVNGILLPPGDLDAWVNALRHIVDNPDSIAAFHRAQLERRSRIKSMSEHAAELVQLYKQALAAS